MMKNTTSANFTRRELALWSVGASLIALICTLDALGAHLHFRGRPGIWEWMAALFWWACAVWGWRGVLRARRRQDGPGAEDTNAC